VSWFGAMQAQDYLGALWALGSRTARASAASVEAALDEGKVLRTHGFRGTWQFVTPEDLGWMLALAGPRVIAAAASRFREVGLDAKTLERSCELFAEALSGGKELTRAELAAVLLRQRIKSAGRLSHLLIHAELRGVLCSGARRGKQSTSALVSERAPRTKAFTREQALAELARRYFRSRGPATDRDLAWWSGIPLREAREAIELVERKLDAEVFDGKRYFWLGNTRGTGRAAGVHLLPAFDEYLVAYQDRSACIEPSHVRRINAGGGMLKPVVVSNGRVVGTWQRKLQKDAVAVSVSLVSHLSANERDALASAAERYARFLGLPLRLGRC
jgi:hypothetical protein